MQIRRVVAPCLALGLVLAVPALLGAQRNNNNNNQQRSTRSPAEQMDVDTLVRTVDAVSGGTQPAPTDLDVVWDMSHFLKGQADTYIPMNLTVTKMASAGAAFYIRVVDKNAAAAAPAPAPAEQNRNNRDRDRNNNRNRNNQQGPGQLQAQQLTPNRNFAWESINFIDIPADGKLQRAIQLKPGEYDAYIAVKERTPEIKVDPKAKDAKNAPAVPPTKMGILKQTFKVPDFSTAELQTSSVLLAKAVEMLQQPLPPALQEANPYVFGTLRIMPALDGKFAKSGEFQLFFWIYGAQPGDGGKPDVTVEYNFHQRLAEGEKYFNKTQPQTLNAQSLPPEFNLTAGHQLYTNLAIPLASFPVGDYRLEIKVSDKPSGKSMTQNVNFTVLPL